MPKLAEYLAFLTRNQLKVKQLLRQCVESLQQRGNGGNGLRGSALRGDFRSTPPSQDHQLRGHLRSGGFALASTLGVDTATANQWIKDYFARLPGVQAYVEETKALAHRQKYVTTLLGRRRYLPELDSGNHNLRQFGERAAVNMPIQGTAADIMKLAMIAVQAMLLREWVGRCTLILQVHDELLFEVNESEVSAVVEPIRACMENAFPLDVRLKVDAKVGPSWAEMTPH